MSHTCPPSRNLTGNWGAADLQIADEADGGDGELAAQGKEVASEAVVSAGGASSQPDVVEGGVDGEWVEHDAAEEVHQGKADGQHLQTNHLAPAPVKDEQNHSVAHDGQQNWTKAENAGGNVCWHLEFYLRNHFQFYKSIL